MDSSPASATSAQPKGKKYRYVVTSTSSLQTKTVTVHDQFSTLPQSTVCLLQMPMETGVNWGDGGGGGSVDASPGVK